MPNVGKFIGQGKTESYLAELHNVQTAVMGMMIDATSGELDADYAATDDMSTILATKTAAGDINLSTYMAGLDGTLIRSGCTYAFVTDGTVTQTTP